MVFKMIEKQYRSLMRGPPYHYHPEIIAVQYILPCFVASYLQLDESNVSDKAKEEYLRFVHELVNSYEQFKFCQKWSQSKPKEQYYMQTAKFLSLLFMDVERNYINRPGSGQSE